MHDDIPDEFNEFSRGIRLVTVDLPTSRGSGVVTDVVADIKPHPDLLFYQNSYVNESYLEGRLRPWSTLNLSQRFRLKYNWQQGGAAAQ